MVATRTQGWISSTFALMQACFWCLLLKGRLPHMEKGVGRCQSGYPSIYPSVLKFAHQIAPALSCPLIHVPERSWGWSTELLQAKGYC